MDTLFAEGCSESNSSRFNPEFMSSCFLPHQYTVMTVRNDSNHVDGNLILCSSDQDEVSDFSNDCLRFITEILMEEDSDDETAAFSLCDYSALQATERLLYDALGETGRPTSENSVSASVSIESCSLSNGSCDGSSEAVKGLSESPGVSSFLGVEFADDRAEVDRLEEACDLASNGGCSSYKHANRDLRRPRNLTRDEMDDCGGERRSKHLAAFSEEHVEMEQYDDVLLFEEYKRVASLRSDDMGNCGSRTRARGRRKGGGQGEGEGQPVDLRALLIQCAQAVASFDLRNANDLLIKIRLHSSQYGDSTQRVGHYMAIALEARLSGSGWQQYRYSTSRPLSTSEVLRAYRVYVSAIPFRRISYFVANEAILRLAERAPKIHVIDFGIFFGFQWPGLFQRLSERDGGAPKLRITGIDSPRPGFRPAQRLEETGKRLEQYSQRFGVPFRYRAIAKSWESVTLEDLDIEGDEVVVVNCLYMRKLLDETVVERNPRDGFLRLIRRLEPNLFIHGIVNGSYGSPFFVTRFKEALGHYSSILDMLEATIPRESGERVFLENNMYGGDTVNVIACEGGERVERPETYRQWQVRFRRAGFGKMALDRELVRKVKSHVRGKHHRDFVVEDDDHWLLQGWKGRVLFALSCWRPV